VHGPREATDQKTPDVPECLGPVQINFISTSPSGLEYLKVLLTEIGLGLSEWFRTSNVCGVQSRQYVRKRSLFVSKLFPVDIFS
jgi:hypothetical protein